MFTKKILQLFITLCLAGSFLAKGDIHYYSSHPLGEGDSKRRVEAFSTELELNSDNPEENRKKLKAYQKEIGLSPDSPIIVQTSEDKALEIADFIKKYKLKNPVLKTKISEELNHYYQTGELGEGLKSKYIKLFIESYKESHPKADENILKEAGEFILSSQFTDKEKAEIIDDLKNENWAQTEKALANYRMHTKVGRLLGKLPYAKNLSKSTFTLTTIRVVYNSSIASAVTFASTGSFSKSLAYGALSASMTALVQLNPKFFEKMMSGKYWVPAFWGCETVFIAIMFGASYALSIPEKAFDIGHFLLNQILIFGGLTTLTQASAEYFAASQGAKFKKVIGNELVNIQNSKNLTQKAKNLLISRLMGAHSLATETYAKVMVIGSGIWATSMAFEAALPEAYKATAVYGTFGVLGAYSLAIKFFGIKNVMEIMVNKPLKLSQSIKKQISSLRKKVITPLKQRICSFLYL